MKSLARGVLALLPLAAPAVAQSPEDGAAAVLRRAREQIAAGACPTATARPAAPAARLTDATVREASYHRILIEGCGQRSQRNYLFIIMRDGRARLVETLPGTTVTDPLLQQDAMPAATMAAQAAARDCRAVRPMAGNFDGPDAEPNAARRRQPWFESWIFDACGRRLAVPMRFTPTDRGTSYAAGARVRWLD